MQDSTSNNQFEGQPSPSLSITELGLSARVQNVLIGAGMSTVGDVLSVLEKGDKTLTGLKGFGNKSFTDLKKRLQEQGFDLPQPGQASTTPLQVLENTLEKELQELRELEAASPPVTVAAAPEAPAPEPATVAPVAAEERAPEPASAAPVVAEAPDLEPASAPEPTPAWQTAAAQQQQPVEKPPREGPTLIQRIRETLAQPRDQFEFGSWIYVVIAAVIIIVLLLPPVSLLTRLGITGYDTLNAKESSVSHDDGITLSVNPETYKDRISVRLKSVPQSDFLMGDAGGDLKDAAEALPQNLDVKSPVYEIKSRGDSAEPVMIDVLVPNEAEPWETLDLYTWTGEEWKWVGGELHAEVAGHEFLRAYVTDVPESVVVVQAGSVAPVVSTPMEQGDNSVTFAGAIINKVNPAGLLLSTDGGFFGDPNSLLPPAAEGGPYEVLPTLRNWAPGATVNRGLLSDVLTTPETQETHIANIVQLCTERGFAGVDVDYRGVAPDEREAYGDFVSALADALHAEGLQLSVVVEAPVPDNGGWDTGGYDLARLGTIVDELKVPFPDDPNAYIEGGQAQRLLDWATGQVDRYKLRVMVSSLSAEQGPAGVNYISLEEALAPFGNAVSVDDVALVETGNQVAFDLSGGLLSITPLEAFGTYRLEHQADDGSTRTTWLGTAESLAVKLRWAQRYHLGGVVVTDILDPGNGPGIVETVSTATAPPGSQDKLQVVWTVTGETATIDQQITPLTEPGYTWTVLASEGDYTVRVAIAEFDHGSVPVSVGMVAPEPDVTETVTSTEEVVSADEPPAAGDAPPSAEEPPGGDDPGDCVLDAAYAADVSIPDNTQLENDEEFVKTWRVKNTGDCAWPQDTVIAFADNAQMGGPDIVEVGAVEAGAEVEISVPMKAPTDAAQYTGVWQIKSADEFFGGQLTVVILAGEVTAPVVVAPVASGSFELGGHVRDTGHPYADKMHYAGMNWTKVQVHYGQDVSGLVHVAHANGFKIQLSALGSPDMVTSGGYEQDFANWVAQMASTGADAIEIWNEPNIEREWKIGHISPQAYTNLLCASYNAIKAANAGTAVISAAPAPTGFFGGCSANGCDDAPWMAGLRDAGAVNCMDYIGAHHNSGATSPSASSGHPAGTHHSWYFLPQTTLYYQTFGGARKLFYTEMGYASQEGVEGFHDAFGWARGTNNAQQAAWLAEAVGLSVNTGMVRCIIVWNIDFVRYGYDPQDGFAIIRPDGSCLACETLHNTLGTR
ncbi:MAG: hypothetical protein GY832_19245 [Chloroflexi bacterium]|nr:hypothetical protein [Chloroflexota bacterium]